MKDTSYSFLDLESIHCLKEALISKQQGLCFVQSANCPCVQAIQCLPCCKDAQGLLCPHSSSLFHNSRIKKVDINRQFQTSYTDALIINRITTVLFMKLFRKFSLFRLQQWKVGCCWGCDIGIAPTGKVLHTHCQLCRHCLRISYYFCKIYLMTALRALTSHRAILTKTILWSWDEWPGFGISNFRSLIHC